MLLKKHWKNILANYIGLGSVALAPILALPWYLSALGPKLFGLISFVTTIQALLGLIDSGMSQALVREFAVRMDLAQGRYHRAGVLLFGFERIYWLFAFAVASVTAVSANTIARYWLQAGETPCNLTSQAILGAAVIFVMQFPGSVYRSVLLGAQAQVRLNVLLLFCTLLRHGGGVIVVVYSPSLFAYLAWQAAAALVETLLRGRMAWGVIKIPRAATGWQMDEIRPVLAWVFGMSTAAWLGALTVQMDKIILSRMIPIEQFGYYAIASTVASGVLQLIYPVVQAVLPHAIQLRNDGRKLYTLYVKMTALFAVLVAGSAALYLLAGRQLLDLWLQNQKAASAVYPLLTILLVGTVLNAFYNVGYVNWIVQEKIRRVLQVNGLSLILAVILIPLLVGWLGVKGAAVGWLTINLVGFVVSLGWLTLRKIEINRV